MVKFAEGACLFALDDRDQDLVRSHQEARRHRTWLSLDIAISVASGTDCLGAFAVPQPGPVLGFFAEEPLGSIKKRMEMLCAARGLSLADVRQAHFVNEPSLRLDEQGDLERLRDIVSDLKPRLVIMDPLVRLHRLSESDALGMSRLLSDLRTLQREFETAVLVVHHARKGGPRTLGGSELRGTGDLHAWVDSAIYLSNETPPSMKVEHRAAAPLDGRRLDLVINGESAELTAVDVDALPPAEDTRKAVLGCFEEGETNLQVIGKRIKVSKATVSRACQVLLEDGLLTKPGRSYRLVAHDNAAE